RLASLLWRLRRASAIETGLFEIQGELLSARGQAPSREPSQPRTLGTPTLANGHSKGPASNGRDNQRALNQEPPSASTRPPLAPSPNVSCAFPILTRPCLTARAATKRDCGAKPRKHYGLLTL